MDCEKFDRVVLDLLYGELDELTATAARRHMEHCGRCNPIGAGLRATREVGVLPIVEPPADLLTRLLTAERAAHAGLPLRQRLGRAVSVLAGYAMRPQLAMAALLLLVVASSLLLLRARPGDRDAMHVTERGVPEIEGEAMAVRLPEQRNEGEPQQLDRFSGRQGTEPGSAESPEEDNQARSANESASRELRGSAGGLDDEQTRRVQQAGAATYERALGQYRGGEYADAQKAFESVAAAGGRNAASAALYAAQCVRSQSGCAAAAPRFEAVAAEYPGISVANEATWEAAQCYQRLGQADRARQAYLTLRSARGYEARAQQAIAALEAPSDQTVASRKAARSADQAAKPAAAPADKKAAPAAAIPDKPPTASGF